MRRGRVQPAGLLFADVGRAEQFGVLRSMEALDDVRRTAQLYRTHSEPACRTEMLSRIRAIFGD